MSRAIARLGADAREIAEELSEFRELAYQITRRDLLLRYKQAVMGFFWAIAVPVVNMAVFAVVFTRVVRVETGFPYLVYTYTGLLPWALFAGSLRFASSSLTSSATLIKKIYFPREILPYSAVLVSIVDFLVASTVLAALLLFYRIPISWPVLFLPVIFLVQLLFTTGMALILAMGNLYFRDVKYLIDLGLTVWMFATPVVYPLDGVGGVLGTVLRLNPMTPIINAYRAVLLKGELPEPGPFLVASALATTVYIVASIGFHRAEYGFAERA